MVHSRPQTRQGESVVKPGPKFVWNSLITKTFDFNEHHRSYNTVWFIMAAFKLTSHYCYVTWRFGRPFSLAARQFVPRFDRSYKNSLWGLWVPDFLCSDSSMILHIKGQQFGWYFPLITSPCWMKAKHVPLVVRVAGSAVTPLVAYNSSINIDSNYIWITTTQLSNSVAEGNHSAPTPKGQG